MVEEQLARRGIADTRVLDAFARVERHRFVPQVLRASSYADYPVPIGEGQTISQPYIVALMTECLRLAGKEKVLEIGTGSGYQTAILAELAKEVLSMERLEAIAQRASQLIAALGYANVRIKIGDGTFGWPEEAPFDRIVITAASPKFPPPLVGQLKEGGRIIAPLGEGPSQVLTLGIKGKEGLETEQVCGCVFVPLIGKFGAGDTA